MTEHEALLIGQLQGELEGVKREVGQIRQDVTAVRTTVGEIKEALATSRGSWKTILTVASMASALGALGAFVTGLVSAGKP